MWLHISTWTMAVEVATIALTPILSRRVAKRVLSVLMPLHILTIFALCIPCAAVPPRARVGAACAKIGLLVYIVCAYRVRASLADYAVSCTIAIAYWRWVNLRTAYGCHVPTGQLLGATSAASVAYAAYAAGSRRFGG